ncbi:hypothetical protein L21SP2_2562 [Salinispira pacifica]|uniref:Uncharacterized protein n=1 Tax=Salinispira pacifica TaxID=1307761 RepID=V5WJZ9_9SPIO|nr:hypothetical protein L21SP2_2562 [Salinispira pacifica]
MARTTWHNRKIQKARPWYYPWAGFDVSPEYFREIGVIIPRYSALL